MQRAFELGLVAVLFLGLNAWWLSTVLLKSQRHPRPLGKPMRAHSLQGERNALQTPLRSHSLQSEMNALQKLFDPSRSLLAVSPLTTTRPDQS